MKISKKLLSLLLCAILVLGSVGIGGEGFAEVLDAFSVKASAGTNGHSANDAINWVVSYLGVGLDYDGQYGCQCVDLIAYYYSYLGQPVGGGNGIDYASNSLPYGWARVQGGQPQKGDILIYSGCSGNPYGHVGIYESDYVTYHQNINNCSYVVKSTSYYKGFSTPYWGYIRPDFSSSSDPIPSSSAPTNVSVSTNKQFYAVGEAVTFYASSSNAEAYYLGVDKRSDAADSFSRVFTSASGFNPSMSKSFSEPGYYSAYVTAVNNAGGTDSSTIYFTVYPDKYENLGDDFYAYIKSTKSANLNLSVSNTNVQLCEKSDANDPAQIWHFVKTSADNQYKIINGSNKYLLEVKDGKYENQSNAQVGYNSAQRFYIRKDGNYYNIVPAFNKTMNLDIENGQDTAGNNIQLYQYNNTQAQKFRIINREDVDKPQKPIVTMEKMNYCINSDITIKFNSYGAASYWVGIYSKDGTLFSSFNTSEDSISVNYPWVGEYYAAIVGINPFGDSETTYVGFRTINAVNLGDDFYAYLGNTDTYKWVTNTDGNVYGAKATASLNQTWHFIRHSDGTYSIKTPYSDLAMDVADFSSSSGANVQSIKYVDNNAQRFFIESTNGAYAFRSTYTNLFISVDLKSNNCEMKGAYDASGSRTFNIQKCSYNGLLPSEVGTDIYVYLQNPSTNSFVTNDNKNVIAAAGTKASNQIWKLKRWQNGLYSVSTYDSNIAWDAANNNGANLHLEPFTEKNEQWFYVYAVDGGYCFKSSSSDFFVSINQSSNNIEMAPAKENWATNKFNIIPLDDNEIKALVEAENGHSYTKYVYNNDATCEKDGTETAKCDYCDNTDTRTAIGTALGHNYIDGICSRCKSRAEEYFLDKAIESAIAELMEVKQSTKSDEAKAAIDAAVASINKATNLDSVASTKTAGLTNAANADKALDDAKIQAIAELESAKANAKTEEEKNAINESINKVKEATNLNAVKAASIINYDKIVILTAGGKAFDYRSIVTITATATNIPEGYKLAIYLGNQKVAEGDNKSVSYGYGELKSDVNYTVKVLDKNGKVAKDSSGNEVSKDGGKITVKSGFFQKLIAFFKGLFKSLPKVEVKP